MDIMDNPGHNISETCNILEKIEFTASKLVRNIWFKIIVYGLPQELPKELRLSP